MLQEQENKEKKKTDAELQLEAKQYEKLLYNFLRWAHLGGFLVINLTFILKKRKWYNLAQFLQFIEIFLLFIGIWLLAYVVKKNQAEW